MNESRKASEIYWSGGTMSNGKYDEFGVAGTTMLERSPGVVPYGHRQIVLELPSTEPPTRASSDYKPKSTDLSPEDVRVRLVETCLQRAKEYIANNDPMQASEKLYKTTEEAIKFLAEYYNLDEVSEAKAQGQWWIKLLGRSAKSIERVSGKQDVDNAWTKAFDVHMLGFHENAYSIEDIMSAVPSIEKLVMHVREVNDARRNENP